MRETILMKKNSGFTLIELMVTIAIIAVVTAITIPNIISWLPSHRLGTASRDILSVLQQVRLKAVKENANVTIQFAPGNDNYTAFLDNGAGGGTSGDGVQNGTERTLKNKNMPAGINLNNTNFAGDRISFNTRGLPNPAIGVGGPLTITIQNANGTSSRQIRVSQTGNSRIIIP